MAFFTLCVYLFVDFQPLSGTLDFSEVLFATEPVSTVGHRKSIVITVLKACLVILLFGSYELNNCFF